MGWRVNAGLTALGIVLVAGVLTPQAEALSLQSVGAYSEPVYVTSDPGDPDRLFVVERAGRIELTTPTRTSTFVDLTPLVDSGSQERGLLSMAFAPDFATSGLVYVYFTGKDAGSIHVAELEATGAVADPATLRNVLTIPHRTYPNHNGGQLQFGPDGYLYIGDRRRRRWGRPVRERAETRARCSARSCGSIPVEAEPSPTPCPPATRSSVRRAAPRSGASASATPTASPSTGRPER